MSWESVKKVAKVLPWVGVYGFILGALAYVLLSDPPNKRPTANSRWGEITQYGHAIHPLVTGTFHGDVRFTADERKWIEGGFAVLKRTSCELIDLKVVWDFDVENNQVIAMLRGDNNILRTTDVELVKAIGKEGNNLLGQTRSGGPGSVISIALVSNKLGEDDMLWKWVVAHELSHAIGMDHVVDGLMSVEAPWAVVEDPKWEREDLQEFCNVWSCQREMFNECRDR